MKSRFALCADSDGNTYDTSLCGGGGSSNSNSSSVEDSDGSNNNSTMPNLTGKCEDENDEEKEEESEEQEEDLTKVCTNKLKTKKKG